MPQLDQPLNHIAIIMDGNGRWAKKNRLPKISGHQKGKETLKKIITKCGKIKLDTLTIFALSTENLKRPEKEVNSLFELFLFALKSEAKTLKKNNIKLKLIGDLSIFPQKIQAQAHKTSQLLSDCDGLTLVIAVNYGGQWDITQASKKLATLVKNNQLLLDDIDQNCLANELSLSGHPPVDLLIRTGGESRISNFLLWDLAYSELFFTQTLWPDFTVAEFEQMIEQYHHRNRRFGQ